MSAPARQYLAPSVIKTSSKTDALLRQTRMRFPRLDETEVKITPIEKGGSDRKFYRVRTSAEQTLILVKYNQEREENRHYVQVANFLVEHGISVPKIFFHDAKEGLIWIEDLGETDLWSFREESWLVRRTFYESALDEAAKLHSLPPSARGPVSADLPAEFNTALYSWEQAYFFENCLGRYFGVGPDRLAALATLPALEEMADRLSTLPRVLIHRDFQSQNIIMRNGRAHLIDFQGMRCGLAEYDLASMLYDPYVTLDEGERRELFCYYNMKRGGDAVSTEILQLTALQRLMQALGAYGFLGLVKGNAAFLSHIPAAMESLRSVVQTLPGLEPLRDALVSAARERGPNP